MDAPSENSFPQYTYLVNNQPRTRDFYVFVLAQSSFFFLIISDFFSHIDFDSHVFREFRENWEIETFLLRHLLCDERLTIVGPRGTSILGEVRNVEISRATQQLLNGKSHDFLAVFASLLKKYFKN